MVSRSHLESWQGGGLEGDELVEPVMGQDEAAGMLRMMAGRADELTREIERETQPAITQVEIELGRLLLVDALVPPPPDLAREGLDQILGQATRFTAIADGAPRAIADDRRAERSMVATIGLETPLHEERKRTR